ncbi:MAG: hypothetical protein ACRECQ_08250 [Burkholderiaceae bacterium]
MQKNSIADSLKICVAGGVAVLSICGTAYMLTDPTFSPPPEVMPTAPEAASHTTPIEPPLRTLDGVIYHG